MAQPECAGGVTARVCVTVKSEMARRLMGCRAFFVACAVLWSGSIFLCFIREKCNLTAAASPQEAAHAVVYIS